MCRFLSLWFCPLLVSNELQYECDFQVYRKKFHLQTDHFSPLAIELMSCGLSHINVCPWVLVHLPESWITCLCKQMFPTLATKFAWGQGTFICSSKKNLSLWEGQNHGAARWVLFIRVSIFVSPSSTYWSLPDLSPRLWVMELPVVDTGSGQGLVNVRCMFAQTVRSMPRLLPCRGE